jgi:hypothetical protein
MLKQRIKELESQILEVPKFRINPTA